jgi:hypothetical protein
LPIIVLILAATAIPVELRPRGINALGYGFQTADVVVNVLGYVPVGVVLAEMGVVRGVLIAALMSTLAEASQFVAPFRDPSLVDIGSNTIGAVIGVAISVVWKIDEPRFAITRPRAVIAAGLALLLLLVVWSTAGDALNPRGVTQPGILEAHWALDEVAGRVAHDSSGRGLYGLFSNEPKRIRGAIDRTVMFDGATDYIRVGHSTAFRLAGSMTISAWIYSISYPRDDAAIVSNVGATHTGFQLDTTIDTGPRTVGFKLNDACLLGVARYGATPLHLNTWYHVAGVYDAHAQTMDVYLNGEVDNGVLYGTVGDRQRSSRESLCIGRRSDLRGYEFAGAINDVRIYSRALTQSEIISDMGRKVTRESRPPSVGRADPARDPLEGRNGTPPGCTWSSEFEDRKLALPGAILGVLVGVASVGLAARWPFQSITTSALSGLLLFYVASPTLPRHNLWAFPLISLAGTACVMLSVRGWEAN